MNDEERKWLERLRRAEQLSGQRLDMTHPPTPYRSDMLCVHPIAHGALPLPADLIRRVDEELDPLKPFVQKVLVERYRESLG